MEFKINSNVDLLSVPDGGGVLVEARVAPFNVPNSFNETFLPGAFKQWVAEVGFAPVRVQHGEDVIGVWFKFEEREDGLYAQGVITQDYGLWYLARPGIGISVSYADKKRQDPQYAGDRERARRRIGNHSDTRSYTVDYLPITVDEAEASEASLTAHSSFPGTWVKPVEIIDKAKADAIIKDITIKRKRQLHKERGKMPGFLRELLDVIGEGGDVRVVGLDEEPFDDETRH